MNEKVDDYKRMILEEVESKPETFLEILSRSVQCNTDNPPGDTRSLAGYLGELLDEEGLPVAIYDPVEGNPNIVTFAGEESGHPHLVLNGHLDQFPADDPAVWTVPPYSGLIREGRVYGRGVSDMKGGMIASLSALLLIHRLEVPIRGRLTFMGVSDEETGGKWGTHWLLENRPELRGDACLNGEPYAPDVVGVGERGAYRVVMRAEGEPMHGSLSAGDNAIMKMAQALLSLRPILQEKARIPEDMVEVIEKEKNYTRSPQDVGRQWMLDHPSYNVGVIRGGTKINVVPRYCEAEVDIRLPLGMSPEHIEQRVKALLNEAECRDVKISEIISFRKPSYTRLDEPLVKIVKENAARVTGKEPIYFIGMGGTDGRFFRRRGIPTVIYGPRPFNMGGIDEHILVDEFLTVIKVHAFSIIDYLGLRS
ncbi:MAG: ArgE/DapE family deacylase [Deltaproteobacteria bacterium]|nr:ArgE/DapE family deacylase [Deltaproteobacteria bacterium]MBW2121449.1 ArgE/DapE family deacylase [Deltaproteobacteria bacterium]